MSPDAGSSAADSLIARDLVVRRQSRVVLHAVSLSLRPGECVCLVGPNGAGKSTLLLALAGLLPAESGAISLAGRGLSLWSRRQIARQVAFVPQQYDGYPGFRVREVLAAARYAHRHPLARGDDAGLIAAEIAECGLAGLEERTVGTLSVGERQRVWLAGALVQEAPHLLLDEPTAALDARQVAAFIGLVSAQRARGRATLMACHDLNLAAAVAERVVALAGGRVAYDGPTAPFLEPDRLAAVFGTPFRQARDARGGRLVYPEL